eukprot:TRINITY_DN8817_c0_g1_i1.p1 TRINITY_DN8817_c0_g1~~TRINITY_DN8817_c0_g1_i1.p1  ORF type:complete len:134 (-),score=45.45 TRINITY_DN8817_c0_g1_i1:54-455(-)
MAHLASVRTVGKTLAQPKLSKPSPVPTLKNTVQIKTIQRGLAGGHGHGHQAKAEPKGNLFDDLFKDAEFEREPPQDHHHHHTDPLHGQKAGETLPFPTYPSSPALVMGTVALFVIVGVAVPVVALQWGKMKGQ